MPEFAEHIEITDSGVKINGKEVPWYIAQGGARCDEAKGTLTLTLLTGRPGTTRAGHRAERRCPVDGRPCGDACERACGEYADTSSDSILDAAKLSLKEAERLEAEAYRERYNDTDPDARPDFQRAMRDELLLANAQASIAVAEALAASTTPAFSSAVAETQDDIEKTGRKIGTATIEVRPEFVGFDGEEFRQAVRNVVLNL